MSFAEFPVVLEGIKGAIDIAKGLKTAYDANKVLEVKTDLLERLLDVQGRTLSLQQEHATVINENQRLQTELANFVKWDDTASRYELFRVDTGKFVYALKKSQDPQQPPHWLCPNCFDQRQKSILQVPKIGGTYRCPRCGLELFIRGNPQ